METGPTSVAVVVKAFVVLKSLICATQQLRQYSATYHIPRTSSFRQCSDLTVNRLKYGYGPAIKLHNPSGTRANSTIPLLPPHPPYSTKQYAFVPHFPPFL